MTTMIKLWLRLEIQSHYWPTWPCLHFGSCLASRFCILARVFAFQLTFLRFDSHFYVLACIFAFRLAFSHFGLYLHDLAHILAFWLAFSHFGSRFCISSSIFIGTKSSFVYLNVFYLMRVIQRTKRMRDLKCCIRLAWGWQWSYGWPHYGTEKADDAWTILKPKWKLDFPFGSKKSHIERLCLLAIFLD